MEVKYLNSLKCGADLHIHSTASDGVLTPSQIVEMAKIHNLAYISIADHDTTLGAEKLQHHLKSKYYPVQLLPAVEISTDHNDEEIHILGYFYDTDNKKLKEALKEMCALRNKRIDKILDKLASLDIYIPRESVENHSKIGTLGRPHIAREMIARGYVNTIREAFERYLARGKPAYVKRAKMTPHKAIKLIKACRGVPIWAHPGITKRPEKTFKLLLRNGIEGMELYHPYHTINFEIEWRSILEANGLLITGGSDFHDFHDPPVNMGAKGVSCAQVHKLYEILKTKVSS